MKQALLILLLLLPFQVTAGKKSDDSLINMRLNNIAELEPIKHPELPIKTASEAIHFTLSQETIRNSIDRTNKQFEDSLGGVIKWQIKVRKTGPTKELWAVKINTLYVGPTYICNITFDAQGNRTPEEPSPDCGYNK